MTSTRRALIFRLPGRESAENARLLAGTVRTAGFDPSIVPYWNDGEALGERENCAFLLDSGLHSAPRLSDFAFRNRFGFSLDLVDLSAHSFAINDVRTDTVLMESVWSQHLRGVAAAADELIAHQRPQVVFIAHGAEVVSRILAVMASQRRVPRVYWESPFFSGYHFVDPYAPHFFRGSSRLDKIWPPGSSLQADQATMRQTTAFVDEWQHERRSKYPQISDEHQLAALRNWSGEDTGPILFVPGQVAFDANVAVSLRNYPNLAAIYERLFHRLPAGWRAVFKPHPKGPKTQWNLAQSERIRVVSDVSIHDLFAVSSAVATHSSNVGLEALMAGLPVIAWGDPIYARKGLTIDLADVDTIADALLPDSLQAHPREQVLSLVDRILNECLVPENDGAAMAHVIDTACCDPPEPRLPYYGRDAQALAHATRGLQERLSTTGTIGIALEQLAPDDRMTLQRRFGEDLLAHTFGGPRTDTRGPRYRGVEPDLTSLFRETLGEEVILAEADLHNCYNPQMMFGSLAGMVRAQHSVVFTMQRGRPKDWYIQDLTLGDLQAFVEEGSPPVHIDIFGMDRRSLKTADENDACFVVLLRDQLLSEAQRDVLTRRIISYPPSIIPCSAFSYRAQEVSTNPLQQHIRLETEGHIIFGPNISLPEGRWRAEFLLRLEYSAGWLPRIGKGTSAPVTLDVYAPDAGIAATAKVQLGNQYPPVLIFDVRAGHTYEFRVFNHSRGQRQKLLFEGVRLDPFSS
jgi:hypothetical protein